MVSAAIQQAEPEVLARWWSCDAFGAHESPGVLLGARAVVLESVRGQRAWLVIRQWSCGLVIGDVIAAKGAECPSPEEVVVNVLDRGESHAALLALDEATEWRNHVWYDCRTPQFFGLHDKLPDVPVQCFNIVARASVLG